MRLVGKTDIGRSRDENQDTFRSGNLSQTGGWGVVCDGMGGAQNGRLASTVAADCIEEQLYHNLQPDTPKPLVKKVLLAAVEKANAEVFLRSGEGEQLMGTTAVCAVIIGKVLHLAHVGDSRAYLFENGRLRQLTRDHSMVQEMVDLGTISAAEARRHPEKNVITRALGVEETVEVAYASHDISPGATVLLCTDGLTNMVGGERIAELMAETDFYDLPGDLVREALLAGGNDNITVLLMQTQAQ